MNLSADPVGVGSPLISEAYAPLPDTSRKAPPGQPDLSVMSQATGDVAGESGESAEASAPRAAGRGRPLMAKSAASQQMWSFERIYDEYKTPIYNYIYHLVGNREQADDLTQDTFLKAFKALPKMDANLKLSAWLYRIATNTAYDALRRRKLIAWMPWQDLDHEPADVESADPQETIGTSELVHAALKRMPSHYRAALLLYTQEGFSYAEIATTLNIAESGVKMYLSRARHSFREHYRSLEQGGGNPQ
ncbi:MAG TPA: RNA polymerase sigma factor [Ktedonobacterales bacterium]|nr:RNA polymerase sigma factor [Ktedonobacterales bacterium]